MSKQFKNFKNRAGKTALTLALVGATTVGAHAAGKQAITTANLNMRTGESTKTKIVMTIPKGEKVNVLDDEGSWWKVQYKGKQGYSYKRYLKEVNNKPVKADLKVDTDGSRLNVRTGPSTNYKIIGKLKDGAVVKATGKSGNWYEINYNGQVGFVSGDYVKEMNNHNGSESEKPASGKMKVTASALRIRSGAGTNYKTIGYLDRNEVVNVLAKTNNGWYKIKDKNGVVGYSSGKYLVEVNENNGGGQEDVKPVSGTLEVTASVLNVRSGAGTGYKVIDQVKKGQKVQAVAKHNNGWYQVKLSNGKTGWVSGKYVKFTANQEQNEVKPATGKVKVTADRLNVRKGAGTEYGIITTVEKDTVLEKLAVSSNGWFKVKLSNGTEGWVSDDYVTEVKDEVKPVKPGVINHAPVVKIENPVIELEVGDTWSNDLIKWTATDKEDTESKALDVKISGKVDTSKPGTYEVKVSATDLEGATGSDTCKVIVKEKEVQKPEEKPEIPLTPILPSEPVEKPEEKPEIPLTPILPSEPVEKPEEKPEIPLTPIQPSKPVQKPELINNAPVITAKEDLVLTVGDKFDVSMLNAKATDKEEGDIKVDITGTVDTTVAGNNELTLTAQDSKGAKSVKKVNVVVKEKVVVNEAPVLTVGNPTVTIVEGDKFSIADFKATAKDKEQGDLTGSIKLVGHYDVNVAGTYNLELRVEDNKGEVAKQDVKLVVNKVALDINAAPKVTADSITINQGDHFDYSMLNAKATDADGDKVTITYDGTVRPSEPGRYDITVIATDEHGAKGTIKVTVTVKEAPVGNYDPNSSEFKQAVANQMYSLVANHRKANGASDLIVSSDLASLANKWSKYMADNGFFDHVDGSGNAASDVFTGHTPTSGENIAATQFRVTGDMQQDAINLANELFTMWKNSPGHNNSMLDKLCNVMGFGLHAVDLGEGVYTIYATQEFSYQKSKAVEEAPVAEEEVKDEVKEETPVVEEEVKEEEQPEVNAPVVEEEAPQVETPEVDAPVVEEKPQVEEQQPQVEEQQPQVEMEDTVTEPTVEME